MNQDDMQHDYHQIYWEKKRITTDRQLFIKLFFEHNKSDICYLQIICNQNFDPTICRKICPRTRKTSACKTKNLFPEYSFHINFRKSLEISGKLNDSVQSYNKIPGRGWRMIHPHTPPPPPAPRIRNMVKVYKEDTKVDKERYFN